MNRNNSAFKRSMMLVGASVSVLVFAASSQAFAQTAPAAAADSTVVVTATRVQRAGFTAPTPTTVQSVVAVEQRAQTNINEFLADMPAVHGSTSPGQYGIASATTTNPGVSYVNLRSLGSGNVAGSGQPARTLVLIDGLRPVFQGSGGAVDLNMVPTIMLDRTEIVTGGASAQYGSDAVAGVVNLIYKKNFNGLQAEASVGQSTYGDDNTAHAAFVVGTKVLGDRGHVLFGASYDKSAGIGPGPFNKRPWAATQYGTVVGAGNIRYLAPFVETSTLSYGGLIVGTKAPGATAFTSVTGTTAGPFHGVAYTPTGAQFAFDYGNIYGSTNPSSQSGGSNYGNTNADSADLVGGIERFATVFKGEYNFTDHLYADLMLNYAYNDSHRNGVSQRDTGGTVEVINAGNPFIPVATQQLMTANNVTSIQINRVDREYGAVHIFAGNQVYQMGGTVGGDFNAFNTNWTWDTHASFGSNLFFSQIPNNRLNARFNQTLSVIKDPVTGVPICSDATARAAGCAPFNPFGEQNGNQAAVAYTLTKSALWQVAQRTDFSGNLHASPFSTWAGKVSIAVGGEYRIDSLSVNSDANSQATLNNYANTQPLSGKVKVGEIYAEAVVPLVSGLTFAKEIDFDGAVREAQYDYSGSNMTWKVGGTWEITDEMRFRISESQDVRAPNVTELFAANATTLTLVNYKNPQGVLLSNQQVTTVTSGNTSLVPEVARTFTYGGAVLPKFLPGFRASVDYWDINIDKAIQSTSALTIVTNCQAGQTIYCSAVNFDPNTGVPKVFLKPLNIGGIKTSGIDIAVDYTTPLSRYWADAPGRFTASWLATYTAHFITTVNGVSADTAGQVGGGVIIAGAVDMPHWLWDANFNYAVGPAKLNLNVHYVGGGVLDVTAVPGGINAGLIQPSNTVASKTYFNVGVQYTLPKAYTWNSDLVVFGNIKNLTNLAPNNWGRDIETDLIGRMYTVGLRLKM